MASLLVGMQTLRVNPLRTVLSTLGIIIGVGALVAVLAVGDGVEQLTRDQIERTSALQLVRVSSRTTERLDGVRTQLTDYPVLTAAHAAELAARLQRQAVVEL